MALILVVSKSLLDLGLNQALYLTYRLTDFLKPDLSSENKSCQLVKNLTAFCVTRNFTSVLLIRDSVLSEINFLSQDTFKPNLRSVLRMSFSVYKFLYRGPFP